MLETLLSLIAPHPCCSCGEIGTILCDYCKYDIVNESYSGCLTCGQQAMRDGVCTVCAVPYSKAWCVGERTGTLQRLVGVYKFQSVRDAHKVIGELLLECVPELPPETVVVPVPTVGSHVRERGFDHAYLIARYVARKRGLRLDTSLQRRSTSKQRDATKQQRLRQAQAAFKVKKSLPSVPHLLIDDVVTTGATIQFASKALLDAGAASVWVAAVSRQPLD